MHLDWPIVCVLPGISLRRRRCLLGHDGLFSSPAIVFGEFLLPLRPRLKRIPKHGASRMTPRSSLPCLPYPSIRGPTGLATVDPLVQVKLIGSVTHAIASFECLDCLQWLALRPCNALISRISRKSVWPIYHLLVPCFAFSLLPQLAGSVYAPSLYPIFPSGS